MRDIIRDEPVEWRPYQPCLTCGLDSAEDSLYCTEHVMTWWTRVQACILGVALYGGFVWLVIAILRAQGIVQ